MTTDFTNPAAPASAPIPSSGGGKPPTSGLEPNVASLLCYLCGWLSGLIFILIEKDNKTVKFHAWHSLFLNLGFFALYVALTIVSAILSQIAPVLGMLFGLIMLVLNLGFLVLWIILMIKAFQGSRLTLPVITEMAQKQADK
jgi:uncharacterized membrane protein